MFRNRWLSLKDRYDAPFDTSHMKPSAVEAHRDVCRSLSVVVGRILESQYAELFVPVVSMGIIINVYPTEKYSDQLRGPSMGFRAFTGQRLSIGYSCKRPGTHEGLSCYGIDEALPFILGYLERLRLETLSSNHGSRPPN